MSVTLLAPAESVFHDRHPVASEQMDAVERLAKGPLAFWFLNHELEEGELLRQMKELRAKGFAGFFMHSRGGLKVPYGSARWREVIRYCVAQAKTLGLEAWLYDEDPYPSGAAGGRVVLERPEFRAMELLSDIAEVGEDGEGVLELPPGALAAAYLIGRDGAISRIDNAAGLIRSNWHQFFSFSSYYPPYTDEGGPHWRAETVEPRYQVRLSGLEPGVRMVAFVKAPVTQRPWGEYTDLLNAEAVELFLRYTHDDYAALLEDECGETVPGIFTDEGKLKGRLPWSAEVPRWFRETAGVDFFLALPHLVMEIDARTPFFRWAYRKALARGLREAMMEPMVAACRRHRLLLTGHISPEEDPMGQVLFAPGLMGLIGQMDLPGTDLIGSLVGCREHPLLHLSPKLASSAAHGRGKRWITCEAFAVRDWAQDLVSLTRAVHWLYALGVNRLVSHGQFYSIDGLRKREAPPSQFFQSAYWEHFGAFSKMVELLSLELGRGVHEAPLLVYYPEDSFMAMTRGVQGEHPESEKLREELGTMMHALLTRGYDFDLADEELMMAVTPESGSARLGEERFAAVVVPGRYISAAAWRRLEELELAGVPVLYTEERIVRLESLPMAHPTRGGVARMWKRLEREVEPLWRAEGELLGHLRQTEKGPLLFLCNNMATTFRGKVQVKFPGPYEICHPQEGIWRMASERLELELGSGLGVLIRPAEGESKVGQEVTAKWGPWSSRALSENCAVLGEFRLLLMEPQSAPPTTMHLARSTQYVDLLSPTVAGSSLGCGPGDRALLAVFDWFAGTAALKLVCDTDLGEGAMEFYLNEVRLPEPCPQRVFDPMNRVVDLAPFVKPGRNHLLWIQRCGRRPGAELPYDALRLFGDFCVEFPFGRPVPPRLICRPHVVHGGFPLPAAQMGHPHYGGLISYEATVSFPERRQGRLLLEVSRVFESMEVRMNGRAVGTTWCAPWCVEIPEEVLLTGENRVELICACSPATYLQALERPSGFVGPIRWRTA